MKKSMWAWRCTFVETSMEDTPNCELGTASWAVPRCQSPKKNTPKHLSTAHHGIRCTGGSILPRMLVWRIAVDGIQRSPPGMYKTKRKVDFRMPMFFCKESLNPKKTIFHPNKQHDAFFKECGMPLFRRTSCFFHPLREMWSHQSTWMTGAAACAPLIAADAPALKIQKGKDWG